MAELCEGAGYLLSQRTCVVACRAAPSAVPSATSVLLEKTVEKPAVLNQTHVHRHEPLVSRKVTAAGSV